LGLCSTCKECLPLLTYLKRSKKKAIDEANGIRKLLQKFEVPDDAKILDFSCGIGRISIPLSQMGYDVTGYDPASFYLREAKKAAVRSSGVSKNKPKFIRGDPYKLSKVLLNKKRKFDAIIIMDNSFGYFGKLEDTLMLSNLFKVASKNCILILETENRDWRLSNFEPVTLFKSNKIEMHTMWKFDFETSVSLGESKFYIKKNKVSSNLQLALKINIRYRLYSLHELREILNSSGWIYNEAFDDIISLKPFFNDSLSIFSVSIRK
jgi:SAM-dependent methyltransferase